MAVPARQDKDEALEILRRLEPALTRIEERVQAVEGEQRRQGEAIAELKGQVSQLPTVWQVLGIIAAVNGVTVAIGFGLAKALAG
jgi:predicted nuclease with TOPRIM domain